MDMTQDPPELTRAAAAFAALGSEHRLSVLLTLVRAGPNGLRIGDLGARCGITGATLTHHLKFLAQTGLIEQTRQGRAIVCTASYDKVRDLSDFLLRQCCADTCKGSDPHD